MRFLTSEVPLYATFWPWLSATSLEGLSRCCLFAQKRIGGTLQLQGYLAHKKLLPPGTPQKAYAQDPMVVLGGLKFLMSEVPLYSKIRGDFVDIPPHGGVCGFRWLEISASRDQICTSYGPDSSV